MVDKSGLKKKKSTVKEISKTQVKEKQGKTIHIELAA